MTAGPGALDDQAEEFAGQMTELLAATVSPDADIRPCRVDLEDGHPMFIVGNRVPDAVSATAMTKLKGDYIPVPGVQGLYVLACWKFIPNSSGDWLKVNWSQFGLWVENSKGDKSPFLRLDVDPTKEGWARAHINVTAESMLLGHIYGRQNKPYKRVQQIHLPVGGYAYRPCLEDFLEFAIDEGLLPPRDGWREAVEKYREDYRRKQLMSLVGKNPDVAAAQLERLGWTVSPPPAD